MRGEDQPSFWYSMVMPIVLGLIVLRIHSSRFLVKHFPDQYNFLSHTARENLANSIAYVGSIIFSVGIGEYVTGKESWRTNLDETFVGWPNQHLSPQLQFYYTFAISFYLHIFFLHFFEDKKKDHWPMLCHHIITILLIGASGLGNMHRIGSVILLKFDYCDVFLEIAKICSKLRHHTAATISFIAFVAVWTRNRLWWYPNEILFSVWRAEVIAGREIPWLRFCIFCLAIVFVLQVYWSYFIAKKVICLFQKGITAGEDPRETSDGINKTQTGKCQPCCPELPQQRCS